MAFVMVGLTWPAQVFVSLIVLVSGSGFCMLTGIIWWLCTSCLAHAHSCLARVLIKPYQVDSILFAFPIVLAYRSRDFSRMQDHNEPKQLCDYIIEMGQIAISLQIAVIVFT